MYVALRDQGLSNHAIARMLNVSEASVRRGLTRVGYVPRRRSRIRELLIELGDLLEQRDDHL